MTIALIYLGRRGGGNRYALEMARHLNESVRCTAFVSANNELLGAWKDSNVDLRIFPTYNSLGSFIWRTASLSGLFAIAREVRLVKPDVLYFPMITIWGGLISWIERRTPTVVTVHDPALHRGESILEWLNQQISIRKATAVVVLSKCFLSRFQASFRRITLVESIPHGPFDDLGPQDPVVPARPDEERNQRLLVFGRIRPYKGIETVLAAFENLQRSRSGIELHIVGSGSLGTLAPRIAANKGVILRNEWVDESEVRGIFNGADVIVLPYRDATQSGVIAIAAALEVPVIASCCGGIPEQLGYGVGGLLVSPDSPAELSDAIGRLLDRPDLRASLSRELKRIMYSDYSWERSAASVKNLCLAVVRKAH